MADCRYSRTGEGLHRFVDPADDRVYLYTQLEVPDARRVYATFEQPDLKSVFNFSVIAPEHWKVISNADDPRAASPGDGKARWSFPPTERLSTYFTALVAGEYYEVRDSYHGKHGDIALGHFCRQSMVDHFDVEELFLLTKQGFAFFEEAFDFPYPFGKYDQAYVPEYNMGAMENAGLRDLPRRLPAALPPDPRVLRAARQHDPARDGAHVVRRPGHHALVGRPVAQRVVRRVGLAPRHDHGPRSTSTRGPVSPTPARTGPTARTSCPPPTRSRPTTTTSRRSRSTSTASPTPRAPRPSSSSSPGSARSRSSRGPAAYFKASTSSRTRVQRPAEGARGGLRPRAGQLGRGVADHLGRQHASARVRRRRRRGLHLVPGGSDRPPRLPRRSASHRIGIGLYDNVDGRLVRRTSVETDITGPTQRRRRSSSGSSSPDLVLLNDRTSPTPRSASTSGRSRPSSGSIDSLDDSLARALCWGAAWDMTRDAEMTTTDFVALVLRGVGTETDLTAVGSLLATPSRPSTSSPPLRTGRSCAAPGRPACAASWRTPSPGSDHQLAFARALRGGRSLRGDLRTVEGLYDGSATLPGLTLDTDLRWVLLRSLCANGTADEPPIEAELQRDNTISGKESAAAALTVIPTAEAKARAWQDAVVRDDVPNETQRSDRRVVPGRRARTTCSRRTSTRTSRWPRRRSGRRRACSGRRSRCSRCSHGCSRHRRRSAGHGLAGRRTGEPGDGPLRPRGARRHRARAEGPGEGRGRRVLTGAASAAGTRRLSLRRRRRSGPPPRWRPAPSRS